MKKLVVKTAKTTVSIAKDVEEAINPLKQKVNMNEITDTGVEGVRFAYQTKKNIKKTIKTVCRTVTAPKRAIRTVHRTITAPKRAIKAVKNKIKRTKAVIKTTAKVTKATVKFTAKAVKVTVKITAKIVTEVAVALTNPIVLLIVIIVVLLVYIFNTFAIIFGGGESNQDAMTMAAGLGDAVSQYNDGKNYYNTALENRKNSITGLINSLYYDVNNRRESDLIYYKRFEPTQIIYEKDFPTANRKGNILNTLDYQFDDSQILDFISIAYVYLEKQKNKDKDTYMEIYEVKFSQNLFDEMIEICIPFSDRVDENQECPEVNCTRDKEKFIKYDRSIDGFNEWVNDIQSYIDDDSYYDKDWVEQRVQNWYSDYGDIFTEEPKYNDEREAYEYMEYCGGVYLASEQEYNESTACDHEHTLHSMGISFLDSEKLMNALGFDDNEKEWVELTKFGLREMGVEDES